MLCDELAALLVRTKCFPLPPQWDAVEVINNCLGLGAYDKLQPVITRRSGVRDAVEVCALCCSKNLRVIDAINAAIGLYSANRHDSSHINGEANHDIPDPSGD